VSVREPQIEEEFEALLDRAERTPRRLGFDDLRRLARLYRLSSARLAVLRSRRRSDPEAIRYLNALCVRAYTHLQVAPRRARGTARVFFFAEFPATLAATAWLQAVAAIVLVAGGLAGATLVAENPAALYACIPASMYSPDLLERLATSAAQRADFLAHKPVAFGLKSVFSASLFVHNTQVGLLAFASGILAGLPTLVLDFYNGITLGAFVWIFSRDRAWLLFWAWLLPHAIPELLAVILCSAGGLMLAQAVLAPGRQGTAAALRAAARPALQMMFAALPLFITAAGIESFLRQSALSTAARFAAAVIALGAIAGYVWYVRRLAGRRPASDLDWLIREAPPGESRDSG
jgi:uncharacterized membrane protein SpoIIM required for sporulation